METELIIEGISFPPLSARGCEQQLTLSPQGQFRRTVSGKLCFIGQKSKKYHSIIKCSDTTTLASSGVFGRGDTLRVGCLQRLWQKTTGGIVHLERKAVEGSIAVIDQKQNAIPFRVINNESIEVISSSQADLNATSAKPNFFCCFRPWMTMKILDIKFFASEWNFKSGWQLELEEI